MRRNELTMQEQGIDDRNPVDRKFLGYNIYKFQIAAN
jgi:hypothetical protein